MNSIQKSRVDQTKKRLLAVIRATERINSDVNRQSSSTNNDAQLIDRLDREDRVRPVGSFKRPLEPWHYDPQSSQPTWQSSKLTFTLKTGKNGIVEENGTTKDDDFVEVAKKKQRKEREKDDGRSNGRREGGRLHDELQEASLEDLLKAITGDTSQEQSTCMDDIVLDLDWSDVRTHRGPERDVVIRIDGTIKYY